MRKRWPLLILLLPTLLWAQEGDFAVANDTYESGNYRKAVELYSALVTEGKSSPLLYNLANAQYQLGNYPMAIWHYEQARALDPANPDISANLKLARDAAQLPPLSLNWMERLGLSMSVNAWTWLAVVSFWGFLALLFLPGLWGWRGPLRRGFAVLLCVVFAICALALAGYHTLSALGIATADETALKLSPTSSAPAKQFLTPGQAAFIQRQHGDFYFVETQSGKSGWVSAEQFYPVWD